MDTTTTQYQFREGDDVLGSDNDKVGSVHSIGDNYLVVEKGFFFPTDYYVPFSAVSSYDEADGKVYLNVTKADAMNSGWDAQPGSSDMSMGSSMTTDATSTFGAAAGTTTTAMAGSLSSDASRIDADYNDDMATRRGAMSDDATSTMAAVDTTMTDTTMTGSTGMGMGTTNISDQDKTVIAVHEEELVATKTAQEAGEVVINKSIVEEARTIEVPVTEERVQVTRRVVDRVGDAGDMAFREETIEVPLTTEQVNLEKRVRVSEEIEIDREAVQTTQQVQGTVRKEVVDVDEVQTNVSSSGIISDPTRRNNS